MWYNCLTMKNSTSTYSLHLGFTLVEMLVVIGIIGILAGVMMGVMGGAGDAAQAAKCLANMKNLSTAVLSAANESGYYPTAGSVARVSTERKNGSAQSTYTEQKGWLSWDSANAFPATSKPSPMPISCYTTNDDQALFAITNGAIWKYMSGNARSYCCPLHAKKRPGAHWSYLMNARFGWDADSNHAYSANWRFIKYGSIAADRTLLFSEIPFAGPSEWTPGEGDTDGDGILQYENCATTAKVGGQSKRDGGENIGVNHKQGKMWFAHVAFADGHVEKLRVSGPNLKELTTFLCEGTAYTLEGGQYVELK